jgi:hypothetical protein
VRVANLIVTAVFAWCVIVQYNDPDPLAWMLVYARPPEWPAWLPSGTSTRSCNCCWPALCLFWMGSLSGGVQEFLGLGSNPRMFLQGKSPERPWVEQTR